MYILALLAVFRWTSATFEANRRGQFAAILWVSTIAWFRIDRFVHGVYYIVSAFFSPMKLVIRRYVILSASQKEEKTNKQAATPLTRSKYLYDIPGILTGISIPVTITTQLVTVVAVSLRINALFSVLDWFVGWFAHVWPIWPWMRGTRSQGKNYLKTMITDQKPTNNKKYSNIVAWYSLHKWH